jgi:hypothetical protein
MRAVRVSTLLIGVGLGLALMAPGAWAHAPATPGRAAALALGPDESAAGAGGMAMAAPATDRSPGPGEAGGGWWLAGAIGAGSVLAWRLRWRASPRSLALGCAGLLVCFVIEASPHLVHHLLEPDQGAGCPVYQTTERLQLTLEAPVVLPPPVQTIADGTCPPAGAPWRPAAAQRGRAPPA